MSPFLLCDIVPCLQEHLGVFRTAKGQAPRSLSPTAALLSALSDSVCPSPQRATLSTAGLRLTNNSNRSRRVSHRSGSSHAGDFLYRSATPSAAGFRFVKASSSRKSRSQSYGIGSCPPSGSPAANLPPNRWTPSWSLSHTHSAVLIIMTCITNACLRCNTN